MNFLPTNILPVLDLVALGLFIATWGVYALMVEWSQSRKSSLNALMNGYRDVWMSRMLGREQRMVDTQIVGSLQNGTAFFASTSLIALGAVLTVLRATDEVLNVIATLPIGIQTTREQWEIKVIGLAIIFVYAFFKFAWAYRLFNYLAIMVGATPDQSEKDTPEAKSHAARAGRLCASAGRHFNHGQRAFFFALGYLGWFLGPVPFMVSTLAVTFVMWQRQFASDSRRAVQEP
jgi:uncharacterized membrane protein